MARRLENRKVATGMSDSPTLLFETHAEVYFELEARRRTLPRDVRGLLGLFRFRNDPNDPNDPKDQKDQNDLALLDVGCGTGEHAAVLARAGMRTLGLDRSAGMIRVARSRFPKIPFVQADITRVDEVQAALAASSPNAALRDRPVEAFDGVYSLFGTLNYLHEVEQLAGALRAMAGLLRPGGRAVLEVWNPSAYQSLAGGSGAAASVPAVERFVETDAGSLFRRRRVRFEEDSPDFVVIQHDYELRAPEADSDDRARAGASERKIAELQSETHRLRLYAARDLERLANACGLRLRDTHADLGGGPASSSSAGLLLVFEK